MADWASMEDAELQAFAQDSEKVEAETEGERIKLQVEWCKRHEAKFILPDGSVAYEPPDWDGG